jgi:hypothetical protein
VDLLTPGSSCLVWLLCDFPDFIPSCCPCSSFFLFVLPLFLFVFSFPFCLLSLSPPPLFFFVRLSLPSSICLSSCVSSLAPLLSRFFSPLSFFFFCLSFFFLLFSFFFLCLPGFLPSCFLLRLSPLCLLSLPPAFGFSSGFYSWRMRMFLVSRRASRW